MKKLKKLKVQNTAQHLEKDVAQVFLMKLEKEKLSKDEFLRVTILFLDCLTKNVLSKDIIRLSLMQAMDRREDVGIQNVRKMEKFLKTLLIFSEKNRVSNPLHFMF